MSAVSGQGRPDVRVSNARTPVLDEPPEIMSSIARAHGIFNLVTGAWPVIHLRSFERVTGPKTDGWLVKTVGLLLALIGGVQIAAANNRDISREVRALGIGTPAALAGIDVYYATRRRISRIYLLDAAGQVAWIAAWLMVRRQKHTSLAV